MSEDEAYATWLQNQGDVAGMAREVPGGDDEQDDEMEQQSGGQDEPQDVVARVIRDAATSHTERAAAERVERAVANRPASSPPAAAPSTRPPPWHALLERRAASHQMW